MNKEATVSSLKITNGTRIRSKEAGLALFIVMKIVHEYNGYRWIPWVHLYNDDTGQTEVKSLDYLTHNIDNGLLEVAQ